jgi:hypothetical protein
MKRILILASCLLALALSCKSRPADKYVGNWTDGRFRHISITATNGGYIVDDISSGNKKYFAKRLDKELIVKTQTGISIFNYMPATDGLFAGEVVLHREGN